MPKLRLLGAAIGALCCPTAFAAQYSDAVFFGDSLTDSGFYAPLLPAGTGRFTTNPGPVWSEVLAAQLGLTAIPSDQGGRNYAAGGARVEQSPGFPDSSPLTAAAPPLDTQITTYLASTGGQADPHALYSVWAGANDVFYIASTNPAGAASYLAGTAASQSGEIARLYAAGARRIVVLNLPDIGSTPFGISQGAAGSAFFTQLSSGYNQALFQNLAQAGIPVIGLDSYALLREVEASPARYGFVNATSPACGSTPSLLCTSASLVAPGADQTYLFADDVHPTTAGHKLIAEYVAGMLAAPGYISQLAEVPVRQQVALSSQLWRTTELAFDAPPASENNWWVNAGAGRLGINDSGADATPAEVSLGVDRRFSGNALLGAAIAVSRVTPDWGTAGNFQVRDTSINAYGGYRIGGLAISAVASLARLEFETDRILALGAAERTMSGDTEGRRVALGARMAYTLQFGALRHGPVISALAQQVSVDGFSEQSSDGSTSSNLNYGRQQRRSTVFSGGWQAALQLGGWMPYASVALSHDTQGKNREVEASNSVGLLPFSLPAAVTPATYTTVEAGLVGRLPAGVQIMFGLSTVAEKAGLTDSRLAANLRVPF
ncbi:MAG: autotransporter domain-containing protein [Zoogloea sp.]|nr:autotransporter domain-containing protein [Zoogloea sp.]